MLVLGVKAASHNSMTVVRICMMGINGGALYNGHILQIISYVMEIVNKKLSTNNREKDAHTRLYFMQKSGINKTDSYLQFRANSS